MVWNFSSLEFSQSLSFTLCLQVKIYVCVSVYMLKERHWRCRTIVYMWCITLYSLCKADSFWFWLPTLTELWCFRPHVEHHVKAMLKGWIRVSVVWWCAMCYADKGEPNIKIHLTYWPTGANEHSQKLKLNCNPKLHKLQMPILVNSTTHFKNQKATIIMYSSGKCERVYGIYGIQKTQTRTQI